jgi:hypothetical protein
MERAMPGTARAGPHLTVCNSPRERDFLVALQREAITYFLDNQSPRTGLVLDRQRNFGPRLAHGLVSTAATGMGLVAVALAWTAPHRLLAQSEAVARVRRCLETALWELPHTEGVLPHFLDSASGTVLGQDVRSTIDTAWLLAGGLWAAELLGVPGLRQLAEELYDRVDWRQWMGPGGLIRHGADRNGSKMACCWDRLNGETIFLYVLAAGAAPDRAWPAENWTRLGRFAGEVGGRRFASADLGLFVFQYGLDLLDLGAVGLPGGAQLLAEAGLAVEANAEVCRAAADRFATYRRFWGLSAGDGPGEPPCPDTYRCYAPSEALDGTAHITASVASLAHHPALVWENLCQANRHVDSLRGRYGFANINLDRAWKARDMVGIDAGAVVLALDNCLADNRIRRVFQGIPAVQQGLRRLTARPENLPPVLRVAC